MNRSVALRGGALALMLAIGFVAGAWVDQAYPEWVPYIGHRSVQRIDVTSIQQAARLIQADYVADPGQRGHQGRDDNPARQRDPDLQHHARPDPGADRTLSDDRQPRALRPHLPVRRRDVEGVLEHVEGRPAGRECDGAGSSR